MNIDASDIANGVLVTELGKDFVERCSGFDAGEPDASKAESRVRSI